MHLLHILTGIFHPFSCLCLGTLSEVRNSEFLSGQLLTHPLLIWLPCEQLVLCSLFPQASFMCRLEVEGQ